MGVGAKAQVEVRDFKVAPAQIRLGDSITLSFTLVSTAPASQKLVIDYGIDYVKASGGTSTKVFKLKTLHLAPGASGHHAVHLLINGERLGSSGFDILD